MPATVRLTWQAAPGASGYMVERNNFGSATSWRKLTGPDAITTTTFTDMSGVNFMFRYTYRVHAFYPDNRVGTVEASVQPPVPPNTAWAKAVYTPGGQSLTVTWDPVPGAARYSVVGVAESDARTVPAPTTSVTITSLVALPKGVTRQWRVGVHFDPENMASPAEQWTKASITYTAPGGVTGIARAGTSSGGSGGSSSGGGSSSSSSASECACTETGGFVPPAWKTVTGNGPTGAFGGFFVTATPTSNPSVVDIAVRKNGAVVLSTTGAAWGGSSDVKSFAVVGAPIGANAGSPITVYRISGTSFSSIISSEVWPDGKWGFSPDGAAFVITRSQQAPSRFSYDAWNLRAANPTTAVQRSSDQGSSGNVILWSPCDDRMMYFRWTQLSPAQGQADFLARRDFGTSNITSTTVLADTTSTALPTASIEKAPSPANTFNVKLANAQLRNGGGASFSSLQCLAQ